MGAMSGSSGSSAPKASSSGSSPATSRRALKPGIEYEFEKLTISRDFSRSSVTRMLVDRAEHGGWELDRLRLAPDGTRRVVLRRKIIRQRATYLV
jgi:hypothetical protein